MRLSTLWPRSCRAQPISSNLCAVCCPCLCSPPLPGAAVEDRNIFQLICGQKGEQAANNLYLPPRSWWRLSREEGHGTHPTNAEINKTALSNRSLGPSKGALVSCEVAKRATLQKQGPIRVLEFMTLAREGGRCLPESLKSTTQPVALPSLPAMLVLSAFPPQPPCVLPSHPWEEAAALW